MSQLIQNLNYPSELPIVASCQKIIQAIKKNRVVIVAGETGSGKTTQLPKMCLEAGRGEDKVIGCTQPRRIAAFSVAARVSEEIGEYSKGFVGYKIRFKDRTSDTTRIKFLTDGMLLAEAQQDRNLYAYDTIIIDEAHERSLNIDFLIGILKSLIKKRKDLKIIVSSATLDVHKFSNHFDNAPIIEVSGRSYPIQDIFLEDEEIENNTELSHVELAVEKIKDIEKKGMPGDSLIFMPTERDILEVSEALRGEKNFTVLPLFGRMSGKEQSKIFKQVKGRKVVVATNVAETSITVPGIRFVIDSGLARISGYNARARTTKLPVVPISKSSIEQRRGRCGRVGPGICFHLYSEDDYLNRQEFTPPEIVRSNLGEVILRMLNLGLGHPAKFPFIDIPNTRSIKDGFNLLLELGAVKDSHNKKSGLQLTKRGRFMAKLPVDPRISRMIIEARFRNCLKEVLIISSALSVQDPRIRPVDKASRADNAHSKFIEPGSDFLSYLKIWRLYHHTSKKVKSNSKLRKFCKTNFLAYQRMREWCDIYEQLCLICEKNKFSLNTRPSPSKSVHKSILCGSLRNIGQKKEKNVYQGGLGKEMMVFPGSGQFNKTGQWIMAAEIVETSKLFARTVATVDPTWIEPLAGNLCKYSYSSPHWEKKRGQVVAVEKVTLFGLILSSNRKINYGKIHQQEARDIFIQSALVECEIFKKYDFLTHNIQLVKSVQDIEERLRRRYVVDDYQLYLFYDKHLPKDVVDLTCLDKVLPRVGPQLFMKKSDIIQSSPDHDQLNLFPGYMKVKDSRLQLSYRFSPGTIEDGVSVLVPVDFVRELEPAIFDWLVPGLIHEKIAGLFKGLPKKIRKQLVPINDTTTKIASEIEFGKGLLLASLEKVVWKMFQVKVSRSDWNINSLADHLQMRYCLVQGKKVIRCSRDINDLLDQERSGFNGHGFDRIRKKIEKSGIVEWDFDGIFDRISMQGKGEAITGFVYPGLSYSPENKIGVKLYSCENDRNKHTETGMLNLYKLQLKKQVKEAKKRFQLSQSDWPLFEGLTSNKEINHLIFNFILREIFKVNGCGIHKENDFNARVKELSSGKLIQDGSRLFEKISDLLIERRMTIDHIHNYEQKVSTSNIITRQILSDANLQVKRLLSVSLFKQNRVARVDLLPRYFKALRKRVERAYVNHIQDQQKWLHIVPFDEHLQECAKILVRTKLPTQQKKLETLVEELWILVEEFKVSIFAQELKTSIPVSPKRLEEKWQEILDVK